MQSLVRQLVCFSQIGRQFLIFVVDLMKLAPTDVTGWDGYADPVWIETEGREHKFPVVEQIVPDVLEQMNSIVKNIDSVIDAWEGEMMSFVSFIFVEQNLESTYVCRVVVSHNSSDFESNLFQICNASQYSLVKPFTCQT